ncbi:MAG: BatA domain-containing protein, partial [Candidatus Cloacimonadaceae bacterium]|nr:BatA domain-containing protein [Candidatus Cloacimonadaceae bacterium]
MFSLSFINTGLLIFAAATVLPLIIWLLAKRKPNQVVFSTLRFIKLSKDQQKNRTKLNNILLLIIRMLIILLVVLSAARPLLRSRFLKPARKHPPTAVAIILDTSYSMDYLIDSKSWLDRAKEALFAINSKATIQDRLILITSDESWNNLHAQIYSGTIPEDLISSIEITHRPLPFSKMLALAETKLKNSQLPNREVYLLSDMSISDIPDKPEHRINIIPLSQEQGYENLSISKAAPIPQLVQRSRLQSISYELINHGSMDRRDVLVKAVVNDVKVAEKFVSLSPNQVLTDMISFEIRSDGWQQGYIEVLDDRLIHDNRSHFAFSYFLSPRIAVISEKRSIPPALSSMLHVYAGEGGSIEILAPATLNLDILRNYNLIVLYEPGSLNVRIREIL